MNKVITLILFISPFLSCNKEVHNPIDHFSESKRERLTHSKIIELDEFDILKPASVIRKENSYMIWDLNDEDMLHLVNFESKEVKRGIRRGSGPGEAVAIVDLQLKDDDFFIFDPNKQKISQVDISSDATLKLKEVDGFGFEEHLFSVDYQNSHCIAVGILEDVWLVVLNREGEVISKVDFPVFEETNNIPKLEQSMLYLSTRTAKKPDNKKVVAATQSFGVLSFLNYADGPKLKEYKQIKYYGPNYIQQGNGAIAWSKDGEVGFCGLDCDDDYVYALYSGRTFAEHGMVNHHCEHLLVYDWDGNPVKHYMLDIPLFSMKYDKENNSIYGIGYNPEGVFVEYQL